MTSHDRERLEVITVRQCEQLLNRWSPPEFNGPFPAAVRQKLDELKTLVRNGLESELAATWPISTPRKIREMVDEFLPLPIRMRCVGGPAHNRYQRVSRDARDVAVRTLDPLPSIFNEMPPDPAEIIPMRHAIYTVRRLCMKTNSGDVETICYLAPEGVSDLDALRPVLT